MEEDTEKGRITGIQGGMKTERKAGHGKMKDKERRRQGEKRRSGKTGRE